MRCYCTKVILIKRPKPADNHTGFSSKTQALQNLQFFQRLFESTLLRLFHIAVSTKNYPYPSFNISNLTMLVTRYSFNSNIMTCAAVYSFCTCCAYNTEVHNHMTPKDMHFNVLFYYIFKTIPFSSQAGIHMDISKIIADINITLDGNSCNFCMFVTDLLSQTEISITPHLFS